MSRHVALLIFAVAGGIALVGQLLVLRDLFAGQTPAANTAWASRAREALWIVLPALFLLLVLVATYRALPSATGPVTGLLSSAAS